MFIGNIESESPNKPFKLNENITAVNRQEKQQLRRRRNWDISEQTILILR